MVASTGNRRPSRCFASSSVGVSKARRGAVVVLGALAAAELIDTGPVGGVKQLREGPLPQLFLVKTGQLENAVVEKPDAVVFDSQKSLEGLVGHQAVLSRAVFQLFFAGLKGLQPPLEIGDLQLQARQLVDARRGGFVLRRLNHGSSHGKGCRRPISRTRNLIL